MAGMMNRALLARAMACGVCLAAFAPVPASADIFNFVWTDSSGYGETFQIDDTQPAAEVDYDFARYETPVSRWIANVSTISVQWGAPLDFFTITNGGRYGYTGAQFFTGTTSNPIFTPGFYALTGSNAIASQTGGGTGTMTITRVLAAPGGAAPEVGLGLLSLLAAACALAFTRLRMPLLRRAAI